MSALEGNNELVPFIDDTPLILADNFHDTRYGRSEAYVPPGTAIKMRGLNKDTLVASPAEPTKFTTKHNTILEIQPIVFTDEISRNKSRIQEEGLNPETLQEDKERGLIQNTGSVLFFRPGARPEGPVALTAAILSRPETYGQFSISAVYERVGEALLVTDEGMYTRDYAPIDLAEIVMLKTDAEREIPLTVINPATIGTKNRHRTVLGEVEDASVGPRAIGSVILSKIAYEDGEVDYPTMTMSIECSGENILVGGLRVIASTEPKKTAARRVLPTHSRELEQEDDEFRVVPIKITTTIEEQ